MHFRRSLIVFIALLALLIAAAPASAQDDDTGPADDTITLDPDGDGLIDEQELEIGTDPADPDTDGDGFDDGAEVDAGTDPLDPADFPSDAITLDADAGGLIDEEELELRTDPNDADSDDDRLSDGFEVREFGTDPLRADTD